MRTTVLTMLVLPAVLLWLAGAGPASADAKGGRLTHLSAGKLLSLCQSPRTNGPCEAYISGISDGITLAGDSEPAATHKVCISEASGNQLRGIVVGWLSKHPERMSSDVGPVVFDALGSAFPCTPGAGKP